MSVKIKRNTGFYGMASKLGVVVNGEKVESIKNNEIIELPLPTTHVKIQVTQQGVKSKEVEVSPGDEIEITTTNLVKYVFPLLLIITLITLLLPISEIRLLIFPILLIFMGAIAVSLFRPGTLYKIEKIKQTL